MSEYYTHVIYSMFVCTCTCVCSMNWGCRCACMQFIQFILYCFHVRFFGKHNKFLCKIKFPYLKLNQSELKKTVISLL